jgi:hypothetical protein
MNGAVASVKRCLAYFKGKKFVVIEVLCAESKDLRHTVLGPSVCLQKSYSTQCL